MLELGIGALGCKSAAMRAAYGDRTAWLGGSWGRVITTFTRFETALRWAVGDQLPGWACKIRTGESVRALSDWNCVMTSPEAGASVRRRPFACELRHRDLQLRPRRCSRLDN